MHVWLSLKMNLRKEGLCLLQVDAMKIGVKDFKKAYKNVNIDQIEVSTVHFSPSAEHAVKL